MTQGKPENRTENLPVVAEASSAEPHDRADAESFSLHQISSKLDIQTRPIKSLKPAPRRLRRALKKQTNKVAKSIVDHGFCVPIPITEDGVVIDGYTRIEASIKLGREDIDCLVIDHLSPQQIRTLRIALNKTQESGEWDLANLKLEFEDLYDMQIDLSATAFETPEIDIVIHHGDESVVHDERANALPVPENCATPVTREGDLWFLGPHRLLCADARSAHSYLQLLGGRHVDLVFTDPPYNVPIRGYVGGRGKHRQREFVMASGELPSSEFEEFLGSTLRQVRAVCRPNALLYVFMDWRHTTELQHAAVSADLNRINLCVWVKGNGGMGSMYRSRHELVHVLCNGKTGYQNNIQLGRFGRNRTNVWEYPGANSFGSDAREGLAHHPTVKPVELIADAILDASSPGDLILDAFLGSGTTIIAAEKTNRVCAGLELDPVYADVCIQRWQSYTSREAIHASSGQTYEELSSTRQPLLSPEQEAS